MWFFSQVLPELTEPVTKVDAPISLEQARKELKFPLPDEATEIFYAGYSQWMAYEFRVKYNAPVEVCKSQALLLIERYNKENPDQKISLKFSEISELPFQETENTYPPLNITWFDVHNITNGFVIGGGGSYCPMIWIDADRGLIYYCVTD